METTLAGKVALVTGAARGLGRAYALHLAALGADVAVLDVNLHSYAEFEAERALMTAETTVQEVETLGRRALGFEADVAEAATMAEVVAEIRRRWGRLDIVVCNAGGGLGLPARTRASMLDPDQFDKVLKRNLYGTVNTCLAAAPGMKEQGSGKIVTVSSRAGLAPMEDGGYAHYGTAKAGIVMYTKYLAKDLGPSGIQVNCIAPGSIGTGRLSVTHQKVGVENITANIPLRRIGTMEDCARVVGFLAGPDSDYVTGVVIPVDGGATL